MPRKFEMDERRMIDLIEESRPFPGPTVVQAAEKLRAERNSLHRDAGQPEEEETSILLEVLRKKKK